ncbi:hypothetical protein ABWL39_20505 [Chitinivorax sp. PXF-14]|uniref:hypothetical protein n=1 Tax=Chitinivorax sp. PXF-14 TaxID=3230488 RepID=UPI003467254D
MRNKVQPAFLQRIRARRVQVAAPSSGSNLDVFMKGRIEAAERRAAQRRGDPFGMGLCQPPAGWEVRSRSNCQPNDKQPWLQIADEAAVVLERWRDCPPDVMADGLAAALMSQVPPPLAIQALSSAIGK